jgi:hypothetical protein
MQQYVAIVFWIIIACFFYHAYQNYKKCDLSNPNNCNFKTYYGLENSFIPFGKYNAELNTKTPLFTPILKENIDSASIIVIGEFGAGKTHIRNYRIDQYDKQKTEIIELISKKADNYLEIFINNGKSINDMNKDDFINIIMAELVDHILSYNIHVYKSKFQSILKDDRIKLVFLVILYSNYLKMEALNSFVNEALFEDTQCLMCSYVNLNCIIENLSDYRHLRDTLANYYIYNDEQRDLIARSLYCVKKRTKKQLTFLDDVSKKTKNKFLPDFFQKIFNKKLVLVVDSLDESIYLFEKTINPNLDKLQAVVDSILHEELLTLPLGNKDDISFDLLIFLPRIKNLSIKWKRIDKIPIIYLDWNAKFLHNYADFTLSFLKEQQNGYYCKTMPDFSGLLDNNNEMVNYVLESLRHPRDFHIFMNSLLNALNENAKFNKDKPFIATEEITKQALERAKIEMHKDN